MSDQCKHGTKVTRGSCSINLGSMPESVQLSSQLFVTFVPIVIQSQAGMTGTLKRPQSHKVTDLRQFDSLVTLSLWTLGDSFAKYFSDSCSLPTILIVIRHSRQAEARIPNSSFVVESLKNYH